MKTGDIVVTICKKCGLGHVSPEEIKRAKIDNFYSYRLMTLELPYSDAYIKQLMTGIYPVTCTFNRYYREWASRGIKSPYYTRVGQPKDSLIVRVAKGLKEGENNNEGTLIDMGIIAISIHPFFCKSCQRLMFGLKNQVYCKGKECQKERKKLQSKSRTLRKAARTENSLTGVLKS